MDIDRIVENHLYNQCCVKRARGIDVLLDTLVSELQAKFPAITRSQIIGALESNRLIKLQYRQYSDESKEISLISYLAGFN